MFWTLFNKLLMFHDNNKRSIISRLFYDTLYSLSFKLLSYISSPTSNYAYTNKVLTMKCITTNSYAKILTVLDFPFLL